MAAGEEDSPPYVVSPVHVHVSSRKLLRASFDISRHPLAILNKALVIEKSFLLSSLEEWNLLFHFCIFLVLKRPTSPDLRSCLKKLSLFTHAKKESPTFEKKYLI